MSCGGYTLVEMLVVVIIIGVLAAISVPQYYQAVENSKAQDSAAYIVAAASANRAYAQDHNNTYGNGTVSNCSGMGFQKCCPGTPGCTNPYPWSSCSLLACGYLENRDFTRFPYTVAVGGPGGVCSGAYIPNIPAPPAGRFYAACGFRYHGVWCGAGSDCASISPYALWEYAVDNVGAIYTGGEGEPVPMAR